MVAYSFQKQFRAPILALTKQHTIRRERGGRSRHARIGEDLQLYTGMRTQHCKIIARSVCVRVEPIRLVLRPGRLLPAGGSVELTSGHTGHISRPSDLDAFAQSDGFATWDDMVAFWKREHPDVVTFSGVLIGWGDLLPLPISGGTNADPS